MSSLNETLIRDVVAEVLGRLGNTTATATAKPAAAPAATVAPAAACACSSEGNSSAAPALRGKFGVYQDANEA
jgi:hypothetical protein